MTQVIFLIALFYIAIGAIAAAEYTRPKKPRKGWKVVGICTLWPFALIIALYLFMDSERA